MVEQSNSIENENQFIDTFTYTFYLEVYIYL